jgi:RNA polymerase sigma-70 factor (ECF subfamily)
MPGHATLDAMDPAESNARLSQMATAWTLLFQAHGDGDASAREARRTLLQRYGNPVYRYLRGALRDREAADELYQEFALKFVRGDFQRAHPDRGRFRDFLKTVLYHLIMDYHNRRNRQAAPLAAESALIAPDDAAADRLDQRFVETWRADLLARAWDALASHERETGQPLYTVLRLRTDEPDLESPEMAQRLSEKLGQTVNAGWVRKRLFLARARFTAAVIEQVRETLDTSNEDALQEELIDVGLYGYCRDALGG